MYDFFDSDDGTDNDQRSDDSEPLRVRKWKLGNHQQRPTVNVDQLLAEAENQDGVDDSARDLLKEAADRVERASLHDFECAVCGLTHGHDDQKHDIRNYYTDANPGFSVLPEFADRLEFNAACHCGVNELAMLLDFFDEIKAPVFGADVEVDEALFDEIRSAADGADIANVTEQRIETIREDLEERFADDDDDADDVPPSPTGPGTRGSPWDDDDDDTGGFEFGPHSR